MTGRRHSMRKIREVLRYRYECKLSFDRIASALDMHLYFRLKEWIK
jgi:hypothetical protein